MKHLFVTLLVALVSSTAFAQLPTQLPTKAPAASNAPAAPVKPAETPTAAPAVAPLTDIITEIRAFRQTNKDPSADVTDIVKRYIAVGRFKINVERELDKLGFKVTQMVRPRADEPQVMAIFGDKPVGDFPFFNETRIALFVVEGKIVDVKARVAYRATK
jgi:hypothetical protein